jgi:hypothetical protein
MPTKNIGALGGGSCSVLASRIYEGVSHARATTIPSAADREPFGEGDQRRDRDGR